MSEIYFYYDNDHFSNSAWLPYSRQLAVIKKLILFEIIAFEGFG